MKTFILSDNCRDSFSLIQSSLIEIIIQSVNTDAILLLGATLQRRTSENIFDLPVTGNPHISDCFLLILIKDDGHKALHEWQDKLEANCKPLARVTAMVLPAITFKAWLKEGHFFASRVLQTAELIYDSGTMDLPGCAISNKTTGRPSEREFTNGLTKAKEFLAGAELFRLRKQHAMAAFMLHQSAEQALHILLKIATGYHTHTHSIDRLIRYAGLVSAQWQDLFPQDSDEEKRLFSLLQKAYINTRYREDYKIGLDDLVILMGRVRQIHELVAAYGKRLFSVDDTINSVLKTEKVLGSNFLNLPVVR